MECYFAITARFNDKELILDLEDSAHINKVLRHKINDEIVVIFQTKKYLSKIIELSPKVICQIIKELDENRELPTKITLVMALLKEQKFDLVIQKAVELGVYRIVPIQLQRCISTVENHKIINKINRWKKIAKAAAQQSNRNIIPEITTIVKDINNLKQYQSEVNLLAYENTKIENWSKEIKNFKSITIVIGPEGGIAGKELIIFSKLNFVNISLGKTILRAETAPIYFLSIINYLLTINI